MYKILTQNGIENTNIDGARFHNLVMGGESGVIKDSLNEKELLILQGTSLTVNACELVISGHRIVIMDSETITVSNKPATAQELALVAQLIINNDSNIQFSLQLQKASASLVKENLFKSLDGSGVYQIQLATMTQLTSGELVALARTVKTLEGPVSTGSGDITVEGEGYINIGDVSVYTVSGEYPTVSIENILNEEGKLQTNFQFGFPDFTPQQTTSSDAKIYKYKFTLTNTLQLGSFSVVFEIFPLERWRTGSLWEFLDKWCVGKIPATGRIGYEMAVGTVTAIELLPYSGSYYWNIYYADSEGNETYWSVPSTDAKMNYDEAEVGGLPLVQETGDSDTAVMSQKATTEAIEEAIKNIDIPESGGGSIADVPLQFLTSIDNKYTLTKVSDGVYKARVLLRASGGVFCTIGPGASMYCANWSDLSFSPGSSSIGSIPIHDDSVTVSGYYYNTEVSHIAQHLNISIDLSSGSIYIAPSRMQASYFPEYDYYVELEVSAGKPTLLRVTQCSIY